MQQHIEMKIHEYLPEINAIDLSFDNKNTNSYEDELKKFTERIQTWSHNILEKAKLPITSHEAKLLIQKYSVESDEGCALRMIVELDSLTSSLENRDAGTAALASMKLLENIWYSSIFRQEDKQDTLKAAVKLSTTTKQTENNNDRQLYQETINNLKDKYPHCNVNALRLLAATRLHVPKQELDDLDISPE
ncbi:MAG: hypothetical protein P8X88_08190 [Gammaproteobacteria bacterium]